MTESSRSRAVAGRSLWLLALCAALLVQLLAPALHAATCDADAGHAHVASADRLTSGVGVARSVSGRDLVDGCGACEALAHAMPALHALPVAPRVATLEPTREQVVVASATLVGRTLLAASARAPPAA